MNCGSEKGWRQHKAANTRCCEFCAPYDPRLANPKKQAAIVKVKPKPKPRKVGPRGGAKCGTTAGFHRHRTANETPCDECRAALATYQRERYVPRPPRDKKPRIHGTSGGRTTHVRLGEPVCDECREAYNATARARAAAKKAATQ